MLGSFEILNLSEMEKNDLVKNMKWLMVKRFPDDKEAIDQLCTQEAFVCYVAELHQESVEEAQKSLGYRASTAVQEALRFQNYVNT
ncbi:hypothetical protein ACSMFR_02290 [Listeria aquatica]|uniref:hypothetical protein n=1 Tax=Listeria aquatica TaxID=1494960 RepID=UPI003F6F8FE9